jgi:predicted RNA-binding protein with EMAP domain
LAVVEVEEVAAVAVGLLPPEVVPQLVADGPWVTHHSPRSGARGQAIGGSFWHHIKFYLEQA